MRENTKTASVLRILLEAKRPLTIDELLPAMEAELDTFVSKGKLYALLGMMITAGKLERSGYGSNRRYYLTKAP